jgi:hypothetical protein
MEDSLWLWWTESLEFTGERGIPICSFYENLKGKKITWESMMSGI